MTSVRIQFLSPATGYIELNNIVVPLSFGLGDIRDISKRAGAFSKSIVVPGTKENKDILSHLYDLNIVTGEFNVNKLQKAIIIDGDGSVIFNNGIVQLIDVSKSNDTFTNEEQVSFTLLVKDTTGDFVTSMGNKELRDLDFSEFNHRFDQVNVVNSWTHSYSDGYKYLMPYIDPIGEVTDHIFHLTEFRPAIYSRQYWDKIFSTNGYSYTWTNRDSIDIQFSKLIHPYNGDVPKLSQTQIDYQNVIVTGTTVDNLIWTSTTGEVNLTTSLPYVVEQIIPTTIVKDNLSQFNLGTSEFTSSYDAQMPGGINFIYDIDYDFIINVPGSSDVTLNNTVTGNDSEFVVINSIFNTTVGGAPINADINPITLTDGTILTVGDNTIYSDSIIGSNYVGNVNAFNVFLMAIGLRTPSTNATWVDSIGDTVFGVTYTIKINSLKVTIEPALNTQAGYGSQYDMNTFIPEKIKQADYIKSICNMFNLFIIPDDDNPTNLIIKTRNEFYDEGLVYDATNILCKEREQTIEFLPDVTAKRITLTYKQDTDVANKGYFDNISEIYGQYLYEFDSEYVKNNETKELIFSPTPNINNDVIGANLPYLSGAAPKTNLRILYDGGMLPTTNVGFKINEVGNIYSPGFNSYPFMGHFDRPVSPTYDLNFGTCDYYFYDSFNYITSNNLYNKFWKRTLDTINDGKLVTAYFKIDSSTIGQFKLNTKIYLKEYNHYFIINKIIDFDVNSKNPTKVELISYDENIAFKKRRPKTPIKNPIKVPFGSTILNPIKEKAKDRFINLNTDLTGLAQVKGFNNFITRLGTNAIVVGSNNYINAANAIVYSNEEVVELPNTNINGPTNMPSSAASLETTLGVGNTTGPNWIEVEPNYGLESTDGSGVTQTVRLSPAGVGSAIDIYCIDTTNSNTNGIALKTNSVELFSDGPTLANSYIFMNADYTSLDVSDGGDITDTILIDPQGTGNGTGIFSNDTSTGAMGGIGITTGSMFMGIDGGGDGSNISIEASTIHQKVDTTFGTSTIDILSNSINLETTDGGDITDTISLDPQGLGNGTGIKSEDTSTGDYSNITVGISSIINEVNTSTSNSTISIKPSHTTIGRSSTSDIADAFILDPDGLSVDGSTILKSKNISTNEESRLSIKSTDTTIIVTDGGDITDIISVDPQGIGNGTGIFSNDASTGDYSRTTWLPYLCQQTLSSTGIYAGTLLTSTSHQTFVSNTSTGNGITQDLRDEYLREQFSQPGGLYSNIEKRGKNVQTTDATPTATISFVPQVEKVYHIEATITGIKDDFTEGITVKILTSFRVDAGSVVTAFGTPTIITNTEFSTAGATLTTDGTNILVTVTGEAATTINWTSTLKSNY